MYVNLYSTTDDPRTADKQLQTIATNIPCKPAEPCALLTPRILLDNASNYLSANYAYISDFDCYYFVELTLQTGRELRLDCKLDPLMSFTLDDIELMAVRSEAAGVNYVPDSKLPLNPAACFLRGTLFPLQPFNTPAGGFGWDYLLTVNGGEVVI